ncbi:MAG: CPBP family intramembrane metalloprotease [Deltaproteobacteria bacterium]|nr:CPBP family intramembrane metalloprotease [Deltaproteobacteria bacterium]
MSVVDHDSPAPPEEQEKRGAQSGSAWHLIAIAIGWSLLATAFSFLFGFMTGLVASLYRVPTTSNLQILSAQMGSLGFNGVLLVAALIQGRIAGSGGLAVAWAMNPVSRLPMIVFMAVVIAAYAVLVHLTVGAARADLVSKISLTGPWLALFYVLRVSILVPLAEELLFRGWLWTALQRRWDVLPTALLTSAVWLAMHLGLEISTPVVLLPVAVILALARHFGRSVYASIALHAVYNLVAVISLWALKAAGLI